MNLNQFRSNIIKICAICTIATGIVSCKFFSQDSNHLPGLPLIGYTFDAELTNYGILNVGTKDPVKLSYEKGISDSCLNLTKTSAHRLPLEMYLPLQYNVDDYSGFSVVLWVMRPEDDTESYIIASSYSDDYLSKYKGWKIISNSTGTWKWEMSDGETIWSYNPGIVRQKINDGKWHMIGFSFNRETKEVHHFFDGINESIISVEGCDSLYQPGPITIGGDPNSFEKRKDTFNGLIDEFSYWGKPLNNKELKALYEKYSKKNVKEVHLAGNNFTLMTWNIYQGGQYLGKTVGIERIVDIIKNSGADIVCFQETFQGGEKIADRLGYHFYRRSNNISLISRFPIGSTYNVYKKEYAGGVQILLDETRSVLVYPIWLSPQPDIGTYVKNGFTNVDSLLIWEENTRGVEMRFILSEIPRTSRDNSTNIIIAGNFNTGSHLDWTERNKKNKNGLVIPFSLSKMLEQNGFIDSYREIHKDEINHPGNTWSPLFKETFSDRIDYIYYKGPDIKAVKSQVESSHSLGFPSDHALVITEFEINY